MHLQGFKRNRITMVPFAVRRSTETHLSRRARGVGGVRRGPECNYPPATASRPARRPRRELSVQSSRKNYFPLPPGREEGGEDAPAAVDVGKWFATRECGGAVLLGGSEKLKKFSNAIVTFPIESLIIIEHPFCNYCGAANCAGWKILFHNNDTLKKRMKNRKDSYFNFLRVVTAGLLRVLLHVAARVRSSRSPLRAAGGSVLTEKASIYTYTNFNRRGPFELPARRLTQLAVTAPRRRLINHSPRAKGVGKEEKNPLWADHAPARGSARLARTENLLNNWSLQSRKQNAMTPSF
ncbi:hypothetical protein EVAR_52592_1 [Eumeta japonica]|uniref:Uncharacterized protein n=1 Tax=Eumeta variegata TaxID=151549 RepID=A0A4C1YPU0_EUMVA|nr:hypothetical protein EVAR_52592_1 [Eumeta japonica]